jgi:hypothetical protein
MTMALTMKDAVDRLNVAQLDDLGNYIANRKAQLQDAQLMREIVGDNRTNPNTTALPMAPTDWSHTRQAIFDEVQEAKAAERSAMAAARTQ